VPQAETRPSIRCSACAWCGQTCAYPLEWKSATIEQFIAAVDSYLRWYNEKRIKISLGSLSPIEYWVSLGLAA
jgi:transposase InsO family protein